VKTYHRHKITVIAKQWQNKLQVRQLQPSQVLSQHQQQICKAQHHKNQ
jgi:hypothetical protein